MTREELKQFDEWIKSVQDGLEERNAPGKQTECAHLIGPSSAHEDPIHHQQIHHEPDGVTDINGGLSIEQPVAGELLFRP